MPAAYLASKLPGNPLRQGPWGWARSAASCLQDESSPPKGKPSKDKSSHAMTARQSKPLSVPQTDERERSTPTPRQHKPQAHKWLAGALVLAFALDEVGPLVLIYIYA